MGAGLDLFAALAPEGAWSVSAVTRRARAVIEGGLAPLWVRGEVSGFKARAVQHEIDHLDGVLFLDHLSAVKRSLLLAKWKKSRKGQSGYLKEVTPEPAGEL